jgi:ABC-type nitrate/sulfonate/bicarbonate transport system permease component
MAGGSTNPGRLAGGEAARRLLAGLAGAALLLGLWQVVVSEVFSGHGTIPGPVQIARQFRSDGILFYLANAVPTLRAASLGWLGGNLLAAGLALAVVGLPVLEKPVLQLGAVSYCLPIVAIGPVLIVLFSGTTPQVILAGLSVFFITLVGALTGLRSVDRALLDSIHAFGGGAWAQLVEVRGRAGLPFFFAALRVTAPASILGSIVGEFMGAERGLGVVWISSQQALNYPRTWALAVFTAAVASAAYLGIGFVGHRLTPWARETHANLAGETLARSARRRRSGSLAVVGQVLLSAAASLAIVLLAWAVLLKAFHVSSFIGKGPADVWAYVFDHDAGRDNRAALWAEAAVSGRDAFLGLGAGTAAALLVAGVFNVAATVRQMLMGPAITLQSVPLVAMTPLIVLIFGRGLPAVAVIGGIVTFFPTLVNLTLALDRTPRDAFDLMRVFGASRLDTLFTVQVPHALPALFASLRIASPLAVTGAMLAEWLATGQGLGFSIASDVATSDYAALWSRVAVATLFSLLLYQGIGYVEQLAMARLLGYRRVA